MEPVLRLLLILSLRALVGLSVHNEQPTTTFITDYESSVLDNQFNASFGDIILVPSDDKMKVLLYYGTGQRESGWGEICADYPGNYQHNIAKVICQQYGRTDGKFYQIPVVRDNATTTPIWLYNIDCGDESSAPIKNHILRCQYNITNDLSQKISCTRTVGVTCSDTKLTDSGSRYTGQVSLCPPDGFSASQSISTGLVMVYLYESWQTINVVSEDGDFGDYLDSVCRQLGYTSAVINSGTTVRALSTRYSFSSCFSSSQYLASSSWLITDQLDCGGSASACSSCCYRYPASNCKEDCDGMNDLVVSCTFDILSKTPPSEGNSQACAFHSNTSGLSLNSPVCHQTSEIPLRTFEIVIGVVGPLAVIFFLLAVVGFCCCCICWCRRRPPDQPLVAPNRGNDDPGN